MPEEKNTAADAAERQRQMMAAAEEERALRALRKEVHAWVRERDLPHTVFALSRRLFRLHRAQRVLNARLSAAEKDAIGLYAQQLGQWRRRRVLRMTLPLLLFAGIGLSAWGIRHYVAARTAGNYQVRAEQKRAAEREQALLLLERLEQSPTLYQELTAEQLSQAEQQMASLPAAEQLRWHALAERAAEQRAEAMQKRRAEEQAPLPGMAPLSGRVSEDIDTLRAFIRAAEQHRANGGADEENSLARAKQLLDEAYRYQRFFSLLPGAQSYAEYRTLLAELKPELYAPAVQQKNFIEQLPEQEELSDLVKRRHHNMDAAEEEKMKPVLLEGAPTFSADHPATAGQVLLLNDLRTNRALRARLYIVVTPEGESLVCEGPPAADAGMVRCVRSPLDPCRNIRQDTRLSLPEISWYSVVDPRPLAAVLGPDDDTFLSRINLLKLLTAVLNSPAPQCPALARAYVFDNLRRVAEQGEDGLPFSPKLRRDLASFRLLTESCGVSPDGECWLMPADALHLRAERAYAAWFADHRGTDYAAEAARNFREALQFKPRYCGYINEEGEPVLLPVYKKEKPLWYLSEGHMQLSEPGHMPRHATPLSPLFTTGLL